MIKQGQLDKSIPVTANRLLEMLLTRHRDDICVPECKTGSSYVAAGRMHIIDLWVMKPSWSHPVYWGYEIKVSRKDFINDQKWQNYLDYCTDFYFVAPPGVIEPEELPPEAGLLRCSTNAKKLYVKKKAPHRSIEDPASLFKYLIMWRTKIKSGRYPTTGTKEYWQNWLKERQVDRSFGYMLSKTIQRRIDEEILKVEEENKTLKSQNHQLENIKQLVEKVLGLDISEIYQWRFDEKFEQLLKELKTGIPSGLLNALQNSRNNIDKAIEIMESKSNAGD